MKSAAWVNLLLGVWLLVSPALLHTSGVLATSNLASGVLVVLVSIWSLMVAPNRHAAGWVSLLLAFWVFCAPYTLNVAATAGDAVILANNGLCGSLLAIFAIVRTLSPHLPPQTVA